MSLIKKAIYHTPSGEVMVSVLGQITPPSPSAGTEADDPIFDVTLPNESSLTVLDGHMWIDISGGSFTGGTVSAGTVVIPRDTDFIERTFGGGISSAGAATEDEDHLPQIAGPQPTGFPLILSGLVAGASTAIAISEFNFVFRAKIVTVVTTAPDFRYILNLRCIKGY